MILSLYAGYASTSWISAGAFSSCSYSMRSFFSTYWTTSCTAGAIVYLTSILGCRDASSTTAAAAGSTLSAATSVPSESTLSSTACWSDYGKRSRLQDAGMGRLAGLIGL